MTQKRDTMLQSDGAGASGLGGMTIGIKRSGSSVQISLQCGGDYHAIELYDRLVEAAKSGSVTIDLKRK
jgi:hypothetical protein